MGKDTDIQWCDSTVNPTTGCDGCELWLPEGKFPRKSCYAGGYHETRLVKAMPELYAEDFTTVWEAPGRMAKAARWSDLVGKPRPDKPWLDGQPRMIFVSDMSDALSAAITFMYLYEEIIHHVDSQHGKRHRWLWLTKQPQRMVEFSRWLRDELGQPWPRNLWVGTSITSQATTSRVKHLLEVGDEFTTRFISAEPLIEPVDLMPILLCIDWLIVGGESGTHARPFELEWARNLLRQGLGSATPVFIKQLGAQPSYMKPVQVYSPVPGQGYQPNGMSPVPFAMQLKDSHGGDWSEWPDDLRVREVPQLVGV